ncbi:NAD(P)H-hydrate dehydratase [Alkalicoccus daliensis]|uniref:Bifunctional NAD(P)H-hydrate repair enzyme n=1 Tax=Alkalicoccus daliensis TaxID=745820 RepID=A0A1H0HRP3_9BACI|nr:NAD(P)H-hydrate dehydratase [Alkalicoccus daliensis]SDO21798.1 NAD(P)H-hydrate epimerase [Alkalicoccus daliensis]
MYAVTRKEMRKMDQYAIKQIGMPSMVLMENAGRNAAKEIASFAGDRLKKWAVLIGKGNNGGDGIVTARHLQEWGFEPTLIYAEDPSACKGEAAQQRDIASAFNLPSVIYKKEQIAWEAFDGIIDALLGTGSSGAPKEVYASLIEEANTSELPIAAMDIPSGLDADTGAVQTPCIQAALTTTFAYTKRGLEQYPGKEAAGIVSTCPIGLPADFAAAFQVQTFLADAESIQQRFHMNLLSPVRPADSNKGTFGHVLVAAGTRQMAGAGLMSAAAALKTGAGLVSWAMPERVLEAMLGKQPEIMLQGVADKDKGDWSATSAKDIAALLDGKQAGVIGPGMGRWKGDTDWLKHIWRQTACALILDADALNILAEAGIESFPEREGPVLLTPHPGEMARLTGKSVKEVQADRIEIAREFAVKHGVTLVLKGARTLTAAPNGNVTINTTGNPKMATGGTGDVLAGVIGSLTAQGMHAEQAAVCGVYLHGRAGDTVAGKRPESRSLTAWDIIETL